MNLGELRTAVIARIARPTVGDALAQNDAINDAINAALVDISSEQRWPWLLTSSSLTFTGATAPLPADCARIRTVQINGKPVPPASLDEVLGDMRKWVWADDGANVRLNPAPSTAPTSATLWYYRTEPKLTADTDNPLLPALHHQTLIARATYKLCERRNDYDQMKVAETDYERGLKNMMLTLNRQLGPRTVRSAFTNPTSPARWT